MTGVQTIEEIRGRSLVQNGCVVGFRTRDPCFIFGVCSPITESFAIDIVRPQLIVTDPGTDRPARG